MPKPICCPHCGVTYTPERKKMVRPQLTKPPAKPSGRSHVWTSMRIMRIFTVPDLASTAECSERHARAYVLALIEAGYVRLERETTFEIGDHSSYRLIRNTGPLAPRIRSDRKTIFDLNLESEVARVR